MYIEPHLGVGILACFFLMFVVLSVLLIIGWISYIKEIANNDMLRDENNELKFKIRSINKKNIIKEANDYND